ncbi:pectinesterase family protein [Cellulosilyticum sp. I15G10I2]|uniref:pectinesterase family protein n=1 Tax=Cellulosilyticum sp. I15G10I2 TaxID=1892843 RepID=UPI00085C1F67|nr:pectinesterase family protein [Cellulosilyticum sp. I15G10I2]
MIVAQDGSGDYYSVQEALTSIPTHNTLPVIIYIKNGTYTEKLYIETPNITLIGENVHKTIITYDDSAFKPHPSGFTFGTFNSYTLFIGAPHFNACNLTFINSAGPGDKVGQAIAAYVDADKIHFKNCRFIGHQDTLFTGPLPPSPLTPGSFRGPRENAPLSKGRHYYENCFIQGDIDFIFGSATAFFDQCEIFSNNLGQQVNGYITAASTPVDQKYGYVFSKCKLTSNCPNQSVYLGRPWRHHAHVAFLNCEMGAHIIDEGWHDWDKADSHQTVQFMEYNNTGAGASNLSRVPWSNQLSAKDAETYSREKVLSGDDHWQPWLYK